MNTWQEYRRRYPNHSGDEETEIRAAGRVSVSAGYIGDALDYSRIRSAVDCGVLRASDAIKFYANDLGGDATTAVY